MVITEAAVNLMNKHQSGVTKQRGGKGLLIEDGFVDQIWTNKSCTTTFYLESHMRQLLKRHDKF